jgi:hypothetical protein
MYHMPTGFLLSLLNEKIKSLSKHDKDLLKEATDEDMEKF